MLIDNEITSPKGHVYLFALLGCPRVSCSLWDVLFTHQPIYAVHGVTLNKLRGSGNNKKIGIDPFFTSPKAWPKRETDVHTDRIIRIPRQQLRGLCGSVRGSSLESFIFLRILRLFAATFGNLRARCEAPGVSQASLSGSSPCSQQASRKKSRLMLLLYKTFLCQALENEMWGMQHSQEQ